MSLVRRTLCLIGRHKWWYPNRIKTHRYCPRCERADKKVWVEHLVDYTKWGGVPIYQGSWQWHRSKK